MLSYLHIFEGLVLHDHLNEKMFMKQSIEEYTSHDVLMTELLYRFDPLNKVNFHHYFDKHEHICLVVRLKNGRIVSGYSADAFASNGRAMAGGLIFSLTESKVFRVIPGKKAVVWDDYYMIFGSSDLRLKTGELRLFSNFGINSSNYNSEGYTYKVLLGDEEREVDIDTYEIFQIKFKNH